MKSLKLISILLFPFFAFGATHTTIIQNTSESDLLIYYSSCNCFNTNNSPELICDPIKTIKLNTKNSNYTNPIIVNGKFSNQMRNAIHIIKIIDLKNNNSKTFDPENCSQWTYNDQNKTDFLTLSNLVDNPNEFLCVEGYGK